MEDALSLFRDTENCLTLWVKNKFNAKISLNIGIFEIGYNAIVKFHANFYVNNPLMV